jgi:hypothetical protein
MKAMWYRAIMKAMAKSVISAMKISWLEETINTKKSINESE